MRGARSYETTFSAVPEDAERAVGGPAVHTVEETEFPDAAQEGEKDTVGSFAPITTDHVLAATSSNGSSGQGHHGCDGHKENHEVQADGTQAAGAEEVFFGSQRALEGASVFSRWSFRWITPLVSLAHKCVLEIKDMYALPKEMEPAAVLERFENEWATELQRKGRKKASIAKCLVRTFKRDIIKFYIIVTLMTAFLLLGPMLLIPRLIQYSARSSPPLWEGLVLAFCLSLNEALRSLTAHQFWFRSYTVALNCRTVIYALLYDRAVSLRTLHGYTIGELVNLCGNDGQRIFDAAGNASFFYISILIAGGVLAFSLSVVGPAAFAGWFILLLTMPSQAAVSQCTGRLRRHAIGFTDRRVRLMNEILTCIKLIKMYAWEDSFAAQINSIRNDERRFLVRAGYLQSIAVSMTPLIPIFAGIATFIIAAYTGQALSASDVFAVMASYNSFRFVLTVLPAFVKAASEATIGLTRIRQFITLEEHTAAFPKPADCSVAVSWDHATMMWVQVGQELPDGSRLSMDKSTHIALRDIDLHVRRGSCVGICGSVGAGKSSLLMSLLSQLEVVHGSISVSGSICYVAQQAWIQSDTLRNNILFGQPFHQERYDMTIDACCLRHDIAILPAGDQTEIGERGINLSGGQKQRISLARALYSNKDIYLLDDPLSAVDAHVGQHIFHQCIRGALAGKTVLFVTHQLQYLPHCDHVVFVVDGAIAGQGTLEEVCASVPQFNSLYGTYGAGSGGGSDGGEKITATAAEEGSTSRQSSLPQDPAVDQKEAKAGRQLVRAEDCESGSVGLATYVGYARAGGGVYLYVSLLALFLAAACVRVFSDWWLSYWISKGSGNAAGTGNVGSNPDLSFYALIYGMSAVAILLVQAVRGYLFTWLTLASSSNLHNWVFRRMLCAPMSFFDTTPTGRILNRFSKDLDEVDVQLPSAAEQFFQNSAIILGSVGLIAYVFPYFLLALVPIVGFFALVIWYFWPCQREVKRADNVTRSPVFSHLSATLQGLSTIQAFNKTAEFKDSFFRLVDTNTRSFFAFCYLGRWFALRLDYTSTMISAAVAFLVVGISGSVSPTLVGLCLTYANSIGGYLQFSTRLSAEVESRMTSVERIYHYATKVESEAAAVTPNDPSPDQWPGTGEIVAENLSVRYREHLPLVLKGVSFRIKPCEKVGIVGRTGSGKSSICLALFRLMEASGGRLLIDGVDIASIGLRVLRRSLSIIPQEPIMFVGSLRYNLDPFNEHSDEVVWRAVEQAHLRPTVDGLPDKLATMIVENGENLSVGERQLVCLARALLRNCRIIVLDEATAAVDVHTDSIIQATIREAFRDCTILTVAHRLHTVLDYDRIMVLDSGEIAEFGAPQELLLDPNSRLSGMVNVSRSGDASALAPTRRPTLI